MSKRDIKCERPPRSKQIYLSIKMIKKCIAKKNF